MLDLADKIIMCARISRAAYQDNITVEGIDTMESKLIQKHLWIVKDKETNTIYIAFRGTDSHADALYSLDLTTSLWNCYDEKFGYVHTGYMKYYQEVRNQIMDEYKLLQDPQTKCYVTGHSLGGAAAILCSLDILHTYKINEERISCITFGTPCIGEKDFVQIYNKKLKHSYHIHCGRDIAPRIPFPGLHHVKTIITLPYESRSFYDFINHHTVDSHLDALESNKAKLKQLLEPNIQNKCNQIRYQQQVKIPIRYLNAIRTIKNVNRVLRIP